MKLDVPAIGILRGVKASFFNEIMDVSFNAGLQAIEITMNTAFAAQMIYDARTSVPKGKLLGAGTVCNLNDARKAADAGAMFFVTPNLNIPVIEFAMAQNIPIISGAFTPTEVYNAWNAGADMVKIFPCSAFGPQYIKELAGPFDQIDFVAVGGVTLENLDDYFAAGAKAVGVSSCLFGKSALANQNINQLSQNVSDFIARCKPWTKYQNSNIKTIY